MKTKLFIRNLYFIPFFAISTAVLGLGSMVVSLWSGRGARWFASIWAKSNLVVSGAELKVEGLENIPPRSVQKAQGGVIIASNHRSSADIAAVLAGLPLDVCWVTKDSLLRVPFIGWHLSRAHIPVARGSKGNAARLLEDGVRKIKDGASVVIFPEGTRNRGSNLLLPFKKGTFLLAQASGRPVYPVAITGSADIWPPHKLLPQTGKMTMRIGPPIDPTKYSDEDIMHLVNETREATLRLLS
ncbi:MAG: lysophospholipid acyltransferase family protein [Pseudomonadota bacterium]